MNVTPKVYRHFEKVAKTQAEEYEILPFLRPHLVLLTDLLECEQDNPQNANLTQAILNYKQEHSEALEHHLFYVQMNQGEDIQIGLDEDAIMKLYAVVLKNFGVSMEKCTSIAFSLGKKNAENRELQQLYYHLKTMSKKELTELEKKYKYSDDEKSDVMLLMVQTAKKFQGKA